MFQKISNLDYLREEIISWRHYLHQYPELAFKEEKTSDFIADLLTEWGLTVYRNIGKTGLVGELKTGNSSNTIAIRADFDALAIDESTSLSYISKNAGLMHSCGHDGHTAILLGAAKHLSKNKSFNGTVYFIFQPAEETSTGAKAMLADGLLDRFNINLIFGLHNAPGIEAGKIAIQSGTIYASKDDFEIILRGKSGHAAFPSGETQVISASSEVISALKHSLADKIPQESGVFSITQIHGGNSFNTIPEEVSVMGTMRSLSEINRTKYLEKIEETVKEICTLYKINYEIKYHQKCPVLTNSDLASEYALTAAKGVFGDENIIRNNKAVTASDDFAFFLEEISGCYVSLGNGPENGSVHTPNYRFNDETLLSGTALWIELVEQRLSGSPV